MSWPATGWAYNINNINKRRRVASVVEKVAADSKEAKKFLGEPLGSEAVATSTATKPAATVG